MGLRDYFASDLQTMFNTEEFSSTHIINGVPKVIQIDEQKLKDLSSQKFQGMSIGEILYYIPVSSYGSTSPKEFDAQRFDDRLMYVTYVAEDDGIYEIVLSQNRGA